VTVKDHYDNHFGNFYSWMIGDFDIASDAQQDFFKQNRILPQSSGIAIDLGAGNGIQTVALVNLGYQVTAVDFNQQLLDELRERTAGLPVTVVNDNINQVLRFTSARPELIVCCGDTISHLGSKEAIVKLVDDVSETLIPEGRFVVTFRDYSRELTGESRFIPVKFDDKMILTCILEYFPETVRVTDQLYIKEKSGWAQKISSYTKIRVTSEYLAGVLQQAKFKIVSESSIGRMQAIIAEKEGGNVL